jgi:putative MATE family efflux protein
MSKTPHSVKPAPVASDPAGLSSNVTLGPAPAAINDLPQVSGLRLLKEAVVGDAHRDFTKESVPRAILLLAVPMVLEMIMESIFAVVDIFWVSRLGADAVATVGLTEMMLTILYAVAMGLSMGATAVVARRTGEKRPESAARAAAMVFWLGIGVSAVIGAVGIALGPQLLALMGASPSTVAIGGGYTRVMLGGSVTVVLIFLLNAVFRGVGDATLAMRTLWLANAINIVLGPFLVFGWGPFPQLGVMGAAVATTIGRGTGVLYQIYKLTRGGGRLRIRRSDLRFDGEAMGSILRVARSGMVQVLIGMLSWVALGRLIASFGSQVVAGYTIAIRVIMFALLPSWGMANAAATLVGQNLGAGLPARAEQAVWRAARYNFAFLGTVGVLFLVFAGNIASIFSTEPVVHQQASLCLRIVAAGFLFYAYGMVVTQALNGAGDTRTPTIINFLCFWLLEIPLAFVLSRALGLGPTGVYLAITIAFCTVAVLGVALFRRGRWKVVKV